MIDKHCPITAQELLKQNPSDVLDWLQTVRRGELNVPTDFHWHALAEVAAQYAHRAAREKEQKSSCDWARVSVVVYDCLGRRASGRSAESFTLSSMMLRAAMIGALGSSEGDLVLDPGQIIQWFFEHVGSRYEEVAEQVACWRRLPLEKIRELRAIKNRLNILDVLCQSAHFSPDKRLRKWLALRDELP